MLALRRVCITRPAATLTRLSSRATAGAAPAAGSPAPGQEQTQASRRSKANSNPTHRGGDVTALPAPPTAPGQPPSDGPASTGAWASANANANPNVSATANPTGTPPHQTLRVGGDGLKLDAMGPLVVNVDGSVGRVGNWAEMTPAEREGTRRLLARRNQERLRALQQRQQEPEAEQLQHESLEGATEGKK